MGGLTPRENLMRPIAGIENRTAQEVFDIMSDRFRAHLTALASGSGDHAELARLAEAAIASGVDGRLPATSSELSAFSAAANPATVLALISEIAALNDYGRSVAKEALGYRDRATEAERKLAEAVGLLGEALNEMDRRVITAETANRIDYFLSKEAERG